MSNSDLINELISKEFEQQYFEECKHIWQNYVPLKGKSNCLQGELLREIKKYDVKHKIMGILIGIKSLLIFVNL